MFTKMSCCRGHELPAPYFYLQIFLQGYAGADISKAWEQFSNWSAVTPQGGLKAEGNYLCVDCFFEVLALLESWRIGGLEGARAYCERALAEGAGAGSGKPKAA